MTLRDIPLPIPPADAARGDAARGDVPSSLEASAEAAAAAGPAPGGFWAWAISHDDRRLFSVLYIGLSIVLSIWISLFWLVAIVAVHAAFEWFTLRHHGVHKQRLLHVLWHLKLDISLVLFALWLSVSMDALFGFVGLGAAARSAAQVGGRVAGWQRALRGALLTVDDAAQVARAVLARGGSGDDDDNDGPVAVAPWRARWSPGDRFAVIFGATWLVLLPLTPLWTAHTPASAVQTLLEQLHPWPGDGDDDTAQGEHDAAGELVKEAETASAG